MEKEIPFSNKQTDKYLLDWLFADLDELIDCYDYYVDSENFGKPIGNYCCRNEVILK